MARRSLPQTLGAAPPSSGPLDLEAARRRLGGVAASHERMGERVLLTDARGLEHAGVLLCVEGDKAHVWVGGGRIVGAAKSGVAPDLIPDAALDEVSLRARAFAALRLDAPVAWQAAGQGRLDGVLREKCRFGALVELPGKSVLAVSFLLLGQTEPADS